MPTSASTGARPRARASQKLMAAARDALVRLSTPPQKAPKASPFAKVMRKAGRGATRAWRTMRRAETTGAQAPNESM
ncbi:MAG: hypothetical protein WKF95_18180 [Rubrobacter sp.]